MMKTVLRYSVLVLVLLPLVLMQAGAQTTYSRTYGTPPFLGGAMMPDGGVVMVFENGLVRTDSLGNAQWRADYTDIGWDTYYGQLIDPYNSEFNDVAPLGDSAILVVGRTISTDTASTVSFQFLQGVFDPSGVPLYARQTGGVFGQEYVFAEAAPGYQALAGGQYDGLSGIHPRAHLVQFGVTSFPDLQGASVNQVCGAATDACRIASGGFFIAGGEPAGFFFRRLDSLLNDIARTNYPLPGICSSVRVASTPAGYGYGACSSVAGQVDIHHFDTLCIPIWSKRYSILGVVATATDIIVRPNGSIVVSGSDWLMQLAPDGSIDRVKQYPGHDIRSMEQVNGQDGYFLVGSSGGMGWLMHPDTAGEVPGCLVNPLVGQSVDLPLVGVPGAWWPTYAWGSAVHQNVGSPAPLATATECSSLIVEETNTGFALVIAQEPNTTRFSIRSSTPVRTCVVVDASGRLTKWLELSPTAEFVMDMPGAVPGLYLLRAVRADGSEEIGRFVLG